MVIHNTKILGTKTLSNTTEILDWLNGLLIKTK